MHRAITTAYIIIIHVHLSQFKVALTEALLVDVFVAFVKLAKMSTYIVARDQINSKFRIFILRNKLNVAINVCCWSSLQQLLSTFAFKSISEPP